MLSAEVPTSTHLNPQHKPASHQASIALFDLTHKRHLSRVTRALCTSSLAPCWNILAHTQTVQGCKRSEPPTKSNAPPFLKRAVLLSSTSPSTPLLSHDSCLFLTPLTPQALLTDVVAGYAAVYTYALRGCVKYGNRHNTVGHQRPSKSLHSCHGGGGRGDYTESKPVSTSVGIFFSSCSFYARTDSTSSSYQQL